MKQGDIIISHEIDGRVSSCVSNNCISLEDDECCIFYDNRLTKPTNKIFSNEDLLEL